MQTEKPTRTYTPDSPAHKYRENHPAYAMIGASRVSQFGGGGGARLFGSDFGHQHYVTISIRRASLGRSHQSEHAYGEEELIEVALSEAQWATFVSSMNVGHGVQATLTRVRDGDGFHLVPGIDDDTNRQEQFSNDIAERFAGLIERLEAIRDAAPTKKAKAQVDGAIGELRRNLPYFTELFDEHAENTVEKAKIEVNAYVTQAIQRAGLTALTGGDVPFQLTTGEAEDAQ